MTSQLDVLRGDQRPRLSSFPAGAGSDGALAVELMSEAGVTLDDWQTWVLDRMLRYRVDGKWASPTCLLIVPRQNGKGEILIARMLAGLFLFGEELITYTAHEFKTATEHFRRIAYLIETSPQLNSKVKAIHTANGKESIELKSRQRLRFLARSKKSGRGFTGDCVILDEAYELPDETLEALVSTMSARTHKTAGGPQLWYSSSAGMETSFQLRRIRERAMDDAPRLGFAEWSAESSDDPRALERANPGLGIRITPEFVDEVERPALSPEGFERERLGIWPSGMLEREIPAELWESVQDEEAVLSGRPRFGLDVNRGEDTRAAIVACSSGVLELTSTKHEFDARSGVGWVLPRCRELVKRWGGSVVVDGGGPAASIADDLESDGVPVIRLSSSQVAVACARMVDAISEGKVRFRPSDPLDGSVAGLVREPLGDRFVWSRSKSYSDATPFMAATLAFGAPEVKDATPRVINLSDV